MLVFGFGHGDELLDEAKHWFFGGRGIEQHLVEAAFAVDIFHGLELDHLELGGASDACLLHFEFCPGDFAFGFSVDMLKIKLSLKLF